mgnify:CR=1 FL=1
MVKERRRRYERPDGVVELLHQLRQLGDDLLHEIGPHGQIDALLVLAEGGDSLGNITLARGERKAAAV